MLAFCFICISFSYRTLSTQKKGMQNSICINNC